MLDWRELVRLSDDELARLDIAAVNLACAAGLPGAEAIDVDHCLRMIDTWADRVRRYTDLAYQQFFLPDPGAYDNSEVVFRLVNLVLGLQRRCDVRYDPAKKGVGPDDPFDFHEEFIHGVIYGPGGTCATIPVVLAAVGRRLGYPLKLVTTTNHMFARWDDPDTSEKVNIEWGENGVNTPPDDYYRRWPEMLLLSQELRLGHLQSLTPRRELSKFLGNRGYRWQAVRDYRRAIAAFTIAAELSPGHEVFLSQAVRCVRPWEERLRARTPPGFPRIEIRYDPRVRRWHPDSAEEERRLRLLEAVEDALDDPDLIRWWWAPLREGRPPLRPVPRVMTRTWSEESPCSIRA